MGELKTTQIRAQLRELSEEDLRKQIAANREALYHYRRRNAMRTLENTAAIRAARKQIARVLTILKERELAAKGEAK